MNINNYTEVDFEDILSVLKKDFILIVTATDIETEETHKRLSPLPGYSAILKAFKGSITYYFGVFGNYKVAHVQCSMGSISRDSSIITVGDALGALNPKVVVMVGIAFGVDNSKQKIGDVLVAEAIQPYNSKRVGKEEEINRSYNVLSSKTLLGRFKSIKTWEFLLDGGEKANVIFSLVLSGEELIDNLQYRDELVSKYKTAKGGEMEGAGVYAACDGKAECILVKGICDFADGNKATDKAKNQAIAINSALSLCLEVFSSQSAFKEYDILPLVLSEEISFSPGLNVNQVLFDVYDLAKEKFYIQRIDDSKFQQNIEYYSAWLYGGPGCGKSNLILRNLIYNKIDFIQVTLASCVGMPVEDFFREILYEIASKTEGVSSQIQATNFSDSSRLILSLLEKHYKGKRLIIFIEEIPVGTADEFKEFSEKIFSLLISKTFANGLENIRFVLSTIGDPSRYIQLFHQKIYQHLKFLELKYWDENKINELIDLIENEFGFKLNKDNRTEMLALGKGSPRFIKKAFRSIYVLNKNDESSIQLILKETERELNLNG